MDIDIEDSVINSMDVTETGFLARFAQRRIDHGLVRIDAPARQRVLARMRIQMPGAQRQYQSRTAGAVIGDDHAHCRALELLHRQARRLAPRKVALDASP